MGILVNSNSGTYYGTSGVHGEYRHISLDVIIESFLATYVGAGKLCEGVDSADVNFHSLRALQELNYDTLRTTKALEFVLNPSLQLVLPIDYVNYIKLTWSDSNGVERVIHPTMKSSNPAKSTDTLTSHGGYGDNTSEDSDTQAAFKGAQSVQVDDLDNLQPVGEHGGRYGLDPQFAHANGSFYIDEAEGKIHFNSFLSGKTVILKYVSDGVVTLSGTVDYASCLVPKLAEEAIYKHILYGVLQARKDTSPPLLAQIKKEKFAETRKAKIRLSNMKTEEITQTLRGSSKIIKH